MKKNMGMADRIIRALIAVIIGILYLRGDISGTVGIVLLVVGCVLLLTSVLSFCPLYLPFKLKTTPKEA